MILRMQGNTASSFAALLLSLLGLHGHCASVRQCTKLVRCNAEAWQAADLGQVCRELVEEMIDDVRGEDAHTRAFCQLAGLLGDRHIKRQDDRKLRTQRPSFSHRIVRQCWREIIYHYCRCMTSAQSQLNNIWSWQQQMHTFLAPLLQHDAGAHDVPAVHRPNVDARDRDFHGWRAQELQQRLQRPQSAGLDADAFAWRPRSAPGSTHMQQ